jgi:hypothetical protein
MSTQVTKVWWDGEKLMAKPIPEYELYQPQEPVVWPAGLIDRIKAAEQRIQDGHAPRRIPADPTDVDLVLAEVRYLLEGKQPPFWINTAPPAAKPVAFAGLSLTEVKLPEGMTARFERGALIIERTEGKA